MKTILKNLRLLHPGTEFNGEREFDLVITDGILSELHPAGSNEISCEKEFDFKGAYASPGFLDMHVHLREPGREDKETVETGCNCAAAGGFTAVASMPNTTPAADSAETLTLILNRAKDHLVDVYPVAAATVGRRGEVLSPIAELVQHGAVAFSDDGAAIKSAKILRTAMEYAAMFDAPIIEHCEDESLAGGAMNESFNSTLLGLPGIPPVAEDLIVMRDIMMAEYTGARVHIAHISTKGAVELVRQAKARGVKVTAEVTPHHFTLTDDMLVSYDTHYKMNPPLRTREDVEAILQGLADGTIDCIATDHAPHAIEEKEMEFEYAPNGILGLETALGLVFTHLFHKKVLTLEQVVEKLSLNPRKILNIPVPEFTVGTVANLTIFSPDEIWSYDLSQTMSKSKNSPFDKTLFTGRSSAVVNKGKLFYKHAFFTV